MTGKTLPTAAILWIVATVLSATGQLLTITPSGSEVELQWQRTFPPNAGVPTWKEYRILTSEGLSRWTEQSLIRSEDIEGNGTSRLALPLTSAQQFFRLDEKLIYGHRSSDSDQPAVYERQYRNSWNDNLNFDRFAAQTSASGSLAALSWDPTTAGFFAEYNTTPATHNENLAPDDPERRIYDFTLNQQEAALFQQNGFVVSPRVKAYLLDDFNGPATVAPTCVDLYYAIWTDDLPVYITADSVLDAWHQTFASILEEIDETAIYPAIKQLVGYDLDPAFTATVDSWDDTSATPQERADVQRAAEDVTFYLDVAKAFLNTTPPSTSDAALEWYNELIDPDPSQIVKRDLYEDSERLSRPNLYKVRGRYTRSGVLSAHFRTLVWLSRAQFHIAHSTDWSREQRDRELRAAILLALTLRDGDLIDDWRRIERMLQGIAGQSDAMTIPEMISLLESLSLDSVSTIASPAALASVRDALVTTNYGIQEVNGGYFEPRSDSNICNPSAIEQPRALSLFGQRWTPDAWTFQKVLFPEVRRDGVAVPRRLPSGLDVAYSTLGNEAAAPILIERMLNPEGVSFRDGYEFHQNLAAVRQTLDSQEEAFWTEHLYGRWLHGLRALSEPLSAEAPDTFRTEAWKRRILNTQLASWTQLRHDTLLFAKQSFTPPLLCEFPDGYVDPYPEMWQRLSDIALAYRDFISGFEFTGTMGLEGPDWENPEPVPLPTDVFSPKFGYPVGTFRGRTRYVDLAERFTLMIAHLENFSETCLVLKGIAGQQLAGVPHTQEMTDFLKATVENYTITGYGGDRLYNGWFPQLYFENNRHDPFEPPSATWNPVVVDVHTNTLDTICYNDPGAILHEGTGRVQFMLTAVKHPDGSACAYGGPVMSHYEFTTPLGVRMSDEEWQTQLERGMEPPFAAWKQDFLVPAEGD